MQCAILSPSMQVKEFHIRDSQLYDIGVCYDGLNRQKDKKSIFTRGDELPSTKILTLERTSPFSIEAVYGDCFRPPYVDGHIGRWEISDIPLLMSNEPSKVKVKIRVDENGVLRVPDATLTDYVPPEPEDDPMPAAEEAPKTAEEDAQKNGEQDVEKKSSEGRKSKDKKPKKVERSCAVREISPYLFNMQEFIKVERDMQSADLVQKLNADAKNALEEYCYSMRDKLAAQFSPFISPQEIENSQQLLSETEEWLYNEGEDASRSAYDDKLQELRSTIEGPINKRQREHEESLAKQKAAEEEAMQVEGEDANGSTKA